MRISFIEPHLEVYGGIRRIIELSNRLVRMGDEVTIYHPAGTPCTWLPSLAQVRPLDEARRVQHEVVIFNDPPHYRLVRGLAARLKVFYVLILYEKERLRGFNPKVLWPKKGRMMSMRRALDLPFLKLANATWIKNYLEEELGVDCELVLGGVNQDLFHPVEVERNGDRLLILATGDPRPRKGMRTVLESVARASRKVPNLVLETYYGKGIRQEKMAEVYSRADLFVDGQWEEGCGWNNPVAEAMACRVAVVCTDIGGVADFAFPSKTALLVPPQDAEAMAEAIVKMALDPALRGRLARAAYRVIRRFDWDDSARRLRSVLAEHLGEGEGG